jgi:hypothetical protein
VSAPAPDGDVAALKLYGERNTGTRALAEAIGANFDVAMMRPSARGRIATLDAAMKERSGLAARLFPHLRQRVREAIVDGNWRLLHALLKCLSATRSCWV